MKRNPIKYIIILAVFSIAGIFSIQFVILRNTYDLNEQQFHESATVALREVAWQLLEASGQTPRFDNIEPVERKANNYFLVNVNYLIDPEMLKVQIREQLKRHALHLDFEYAIYDSERDSMIYMEYVCAGDNSCQHIPLEYFPKSDKYINYFGINFPTLKPFIRERLIGWYFMTSLLVVVLTFFGYAMWVIIRQRQLSEIQKTFINNLTHELKTPISSIGLAAQVLNDKNIIQNPDRLFSYVRIINEQSLRLAGNVEKVLNLVSLEKNKLQLIKEEIDLSRFIEGTTGRFMQSELGHLAKINLSLPEKTIKIWADPFHFDNIVQNMLENAVKYCKGQPKIDISILVKRNTVCLTITDNGIGIPRDFRKKIFRKFFRVPTGNIHDVKGFGLGLDYVYKLTRAHRWRINVTDNPAGGSIFTLIIKYRHE
jgi:two-component system, OmpR family, phosphate regulon sensor histidine kinase PhoR